MKETITIFTIGFTRKSAEQFFRTLKEAGVKRVLDTRLGNHSQLAGFSKKPDLAYFLQVINQMEYCHTLMLAPSRELLQAYRRNPQDWSSYEAGFLALMRERQVEQQFTPQDLDHTCLLCSEDKPHHCHRRLVAEYLQVKWGNINLCHL